MREGSQALFGLFRIWWREEKCVISTKSEGKWWCSTRTRRREMNRMRYIRCLTFPRIQAGFLLWACHTFPTLDQSAQAEVFTCCNLFSLNCSFENWSQIARYCIPGRLSRGNWTSFKPLKTLYLSSKKLIRRWVLKNFWGEETSRKRSAVAPKHSGKP